MQFSSVIASLALVGSIQAKFHNTTGGAGVTNSTGGAAAGGKNSTGAAGGASNGTAAGAGGKNSTGGAGSANAGVVANTNIYGGAAIVAAAVALLY
ncbi:hypothetical protein KGF54_000947 [Candida jiufengensis]|uniref:uncharacterized protein n=1 Tax=Candida jiufengensis TaxID=497108 RepID=UPI0022248F82|nr:uncharacterized protein KGF54_000947 [Candida jiufengensis]KAI5956472.1 hypothetical protein KGF54_000947 [Candida jiufengensis]